MTRLVPSPKPSTQCSLSWKRLIETSTNPIRISGSSLPIAHTNFAPPLTLILSNLDVLAKVGDGDPVFRKQALSDIRAESDRMARMVTQLLILARADAGAEVGQHAVALDDLVAQTCKQAQKMANGVRFIATDTHALDGAVALGSSEYLRQALLILLDNAFKYTPSTGEVRVEAEVQDGTARIIISDTGTGIDAHDLPLIFERPREECGWCHRNRSRSVDSFLGRESTRRRHRDGEHAGTRLAFLPRSSCCFSPDHHSGAPGVTKLAQCPGKK